MENNIQTDIESNTQIPNMDCVGATEDGRVFHFYDGCLEQSPGSSIDRSLSGTGFAGGNQFLDSPIVPGGHQLFDSPVVLTIEDEITDLEDNHSKSNTNSTEEKRGIACRICQSEFGEDLNHDELGGVAIGLGCKCKGDLGVAHQNCAAIWFQIKGNIICEICGDAAKNVGIDQGSSPRQCATETSPTTVNVADRVENENACEHCLGWMMCILVIVVVAISCYMQFRHSSYHDRTLQ